MTGLDIVALVFLVLICLILVSSFCTLAILPGRIARNRKHPYADAVKIGGWATLLFGGLFWPLILVWAYAAGPSKFEPELEQLVKIPDQGD
jgi:hypothetical protein